MTYSVVIPAYNEAQYIGQMLDSLCKQTVLPAEAIVVDDSSTDKTASIVAGYASQHQWIKLVKNESEAIHLPGSKVVRAFQTGFGNLNGDHDIVVKLDADLILPPNYFEKIIEIFESDETIGLAGGFAAIQKNGKWIIENLTDKDHIRGAFKAYRKECFAQIGGLKPAMGWDTVDELLARYHGWKVVTVPELIVKHLKPTGSVYGKAARFKQGEAFHALGYGIAITAIASAKLAMMKKKPLLFFDYILGYWKSIGKPLLVSENEARFIRNYRWKKIKAKFLS